ncbi:glycosyltransferase family 9 protein [Hymenobacter sp. BT730]|uniref:glycosyltransferase family 9 protein n=1 Tax=Hymenobacter sp. BT730 TaxID=3063332 RepID=UPI0026E0E07D|nr:glycosyltransferase family 9 protein [Hymenobacter sp. BT730]
MKTFLVSRTDAIGDVVLTLPVCGQLKKMFPGCRVVLLGRTYTQAIAAACPWIDDFINVDELRQLTPAAQVVELQEQHADAFLHIFPDKHLAALARQARIPMRIGTRNRWFHWLTCTHRVALSRRHSPLHEAQLNLALLRPLGYSGIMPLADVGELVKLHPTEALAQEWQRLLALRQSGQLNVILHPRSRGSAREWGLSNFGTLARMLQQAGHRVFITGTSAEGEELRPWLTEHAPFLAGDMTGKLTLPQLLAFIAAADGLVANSTGPLHMAAALGRHALGLYPSIRPMHPGRWAPVGPQAEFLVFNQPDCQQCRKEPAACSCLAAINPVEVLNRINVWESLPPAGF